MSPATSSAGPPRILTTFNHARPPREPQRSWHHVGLSASIFPKAMIASPGHRSDQLLLRPVSPKLACLTLSSATPEARAHQHLADPFVSIPLLPQVVPPEASHLYPPPPTTLEALLHPARGHSLPPPPLRRTVREPLSPQTAQPSTPPSTAMTKVTRATMLPLYAVAPSSRLRRS